MPRKIAPVVVLLGLFLSAGFQAQAQAEYDQSENPKQVSIRFRAMGWTGTGKDLFYMEDGQKHPFTATSANPSKWLRYRGPTPLYLYKEGETITRNDGTVLPRPVGSFTPESSGDWLLLLSEGKDNSGRLSYKVFPVNESQSKVEAGLRIVNFTQKEIAIKLNDITKRIKPGADEHMIPTARNDNSLSVMIASNNDGEWKMEYSNLFRSKPELRTTVFISNPDQRIHVRRFVDKATNSNP